MGRVLRWLAAGLMATAGVVVAAPTTPAFAEGGSISGTVTLPSGAPAEGLCVRAAPWSSGADAFATTGTDGTYQLDVSDGTYRVEFRDCGTPHDLVTGWWPDKLTENDATTLTVSGAPVTGIDEHMVQGGRIVGRALDRQGAPVNNAQVWLQQPTASAISGLVSTRTGSDGSYVLLGVAPGSWRVMASLPPDYPVTFSGDTDNYKTATLFDVTASNTTTATDIHLGRAATISGTVVDEVGQPRAGVCVTAWGSSESTELASAQTASDGTYTLTGVYPGSDRVSVSACQGPLVWYPSGDSYAHATPVDAAEGATVTGIDMTLPNGPVIAGTVTDTNGNPVAGVAISLYDGVTHASTPGGTSTDADGHYTVTGLRSKLYLVEADPVYSSRPELVQRFWPVAPSRQGAAPIPASVATTGIDFVLPVGGSISGHVTTAANGAPLSRVCVTAANTDPDLTRYATTTADGSYSIRGIDAGTFDVKFADCNGLYDVAPTYWQGTDAIGSGTQVSTTLGQPSTSVDQVMQPGGTMHGRVIDAAGNPIPHVCLYMPSVDPSISYGSAITDNTGGWTASGLAPNRRFRVRAHACDPSAPWVPKSLPDPYTVTAGGDTGVPDIVLHHGGAFSGTVTDQYGHPVAGACVVSEPSDPDGTAGYFRTTINGTYLAGGLEPGTYSAYFTDCGVGMVSTYWKSPTYDGRATFTVTSDNTTTGIDQTVVVFTLPTAPTAVTVEPSDGAATLTWQPPTSTGNTDITGYAVTGPAGTTTLVAGARSYRFTGLSNGATYQFSVAAINAKGTGAAQAVAATLLPVRSVTITGPTSVVSGRTATLQGRAVLTNGVGAASRAVTVYQRPAGSTSPWRAFTQARTDSNGYWRATVAPVRPTAYRVSVGGVSAVRVQQVSAVLAAAVRSGRLLLASTPTRPGALVLVQRRRADGTWVTWARTLLNSTGHLTVTVPAGRWRGCLPAGGYWAVTCSAAVSAA